ncbi:hypothetical protein PFFCH_02932 [Plasmodium falciparum FCH/4]|uniref:Nudix hydrolase domain-containing protein n=1 Tax=Plasmodium falciparum FCH/4 TaxID=1036724 RepID=A0A024VMD9_PLAFA|nr:hypothetical protein PFFCH_02932 [Plasmodium falciparum FCH/4]
MPNNKLQKNLANKLPNSSKGTKLFSAQRIKQLAKDKKLLDDALLDCYGRFIALLPEFLLKDHVHLYFQIQEAYWWYDDMWQDKYPDKLPKLSLKTFGYLICDDCPILKKYVPPSAHEQFSLNWRRYCRTIPLRGAILLNHDLRKCLLVKGWSTDSWSFPRGKVDELEEDSVCACREIYEEIGIDIFPYIDEQVYIETHIEDQPIKLFVIPGIREDTKFQPKTRKEIGDIRWFDIEKLLEYKDSKRRKETFFDNKKERINYMFVCPFIPNLIKWINVLKLSIKGKVSKKNTYVSGSSILSYKYQITGIDAHIIKKLQNADMETKDMYKSNYYFFKSDDDYYYDEEVDSLSNKDTYADVLNVNSINSDMMKQYNTFDKGYVSMSNDSSNNNNNNNNNNSHMLINNSVYKNEEGSNIPYGNIYNNFVPNVFNMDNMKKDHIMDKCNEDNMNDHMMNNNMNHNIIYDKKVMSNNNIKHNNNNNNIKHNNNYHNNNSNNKDAKKVINNMLVKGNMNNNNNNNYNNNYYHYNNKYYYNNKYMYYPNYNINYGNNYNMYYNRGYHSYFNKNGDQDFYQKMYRNHIKKIGVGHLSALRLKEVGLRSFDDQYIEKRKYFQMRVYGNNKNKLLYNAKNDIYGNHRKMMRNAYRSVDDSSVYYKSSRNTNLDACNEKTFGENHMNGWSAEDMFKLNEQKFGIQSTYNIDNYTTPLNCNDEKKSSRYVKETLKSVNVKGVSSNGLNGLLSASFDKSPVNKEIQYFLNNTKNMLSKGNMNSTNENVDMVITKSSNNNNINENKNKNNNDNISEMNKLSKCVDSNPNLNVGKEEVDHIKMVKNKNILDITKKNNNNNNNDNVHVDNSKKVMMKKKKKSLGEMSKGIERNGSYYSLKGDIREKNKENVKNNKMISNVMDTNTYDNNNIKLKKNDNLSNKLKNNKNNDIFINDNKKMNSQNMVVNKNVFSPSTSVSNICDDRDIVKKLSVSSKKNVKDKFDIFNFDDSYTDDDMDDKDVSCINGEDDINVNTLTGKILMGLIKGSSSLNNEEEENTAKMNKQLDVKNGIDNNNNNNNINEGVVINNKKKDTVKNNSCQRKKEIHITSEIYKDNHKKKDVKKIHMEKANSRRNDQINNDDNKTVKDKMKRKNKTTVDNKRSENFNETEIMEKLSKHLNSYNPFE